MKMSVKSARIIAEKTQQFMADALGISKCTYQRIEKDPGSATITQARKISDIVGVPLDDIFFAQDST